MRNTKKTSDYKIVCSEEVYKFACMHFLIKFILFILIEKITLKNKKVHFSTKISEIRKKRRIVKLFA